MLHGELKRRDGECSELIRRLLSEIGLIRESRRIKGNLW
jgi:hypothetical protein